MRINNKMRFMPIILVLLLVSMMALPVATSVVYAAEPTVKLGTASSFAVLAGETITNTGSTTVDGTAGGNIGLHPGTSFTGQASVTLNGNAVHLTDAVALQAKTDLLTAYNDAAGRTTDETISADLGGTTLTPGVYTSSSSIGITGTLTLDGGGDPNAVFIFKAGSTLTTASASRIELINGAQLCHVFWQVGSSATLGTNSTFVGHILAQTSITATTGARINGQLLALNGAVTLDNNTIINDRCIDSSNGSEDEPSNGSDDSSSDTDVELSTGELTVTKVVSGEIGDMTLPLYEITVTGPEDFSATRTFVHGESYTWDNLVPGTYTVTENRTGLSSQWTVGGEGTVQVTADQTAATTITNAYISGVVAPGDTTTTGDDETPVLGIVELPRTGGNPLLMIFTGLLLFGMGLMLRRKEN